MMKNKFNIKKINGNITKVESKFNKVDEWLIPRERFSFYLTHDFHPYFAAYPPELVSKILTKYSKPGDVFLDPFMGGGSSIVEGFKLKRTTIGIDISPFSKFISEVKTRPVDIDSKEVKRALSKMASDIFEHKLVSYKNFNYPIPDVTNIDKWFNEVSKCDLAIILHHINQIKDKNFKNFLLLGFSSIVRKVSNAKNSQQHLCIKKGKKIPEVFPLFEKKINLMMSQMKDYVSEIGDTKHYELPSLYTHDIRKMDKIIDPESVDIIITSPPYGTGSRYTDINRLNFEWLGLEKPKKDETLEKASDFKLELKKSMEKMYKVLKGGKFCFIVYGDPSTDNSLTKVAINDAIGIGFEYEGLITCPIEKTITNHHEKYRRFIPKDFILIFKKPI